jgi:hypothetical protein
MMVGAMPMPSNSAAAESYARLGRLFPTIGRKIAGHHRGGVCSSTGVGHSFRRALAWLICAFLLIAIARVKSSLNV